MDRIGENTIANIPEGKIGTEVINAVKSIGNAQESMLIVALVMPDENHDALFSFTYGRWWKIVSRNHDDSSLVCVPFATGSELLEKGDLIIYYTLEKRD